MQTSPAGDSVGSSEAVPAGELTDDDIRERARATAEDLGEADPTDIEWVRSTRSEAAEVMSGSVVDGGEVDDPEVIVIQARGAFVVQGEGGLPDAAGHTVPPSEGTAFTLLVEVSSGSFLGLGVTPEPVPLGDLGEVHRL